MSDRTHKVVCKTVGAKRFLLKEWSWLGRCLMDGKPTDQGSALAVRDDLQANGFKWGVDSYLKRVDNPLDDGEFTIGAQDLW